jgi:hypothetical protein
MLNYINDAVVWAHNPANPNAIVHHMGEHAFVPPLRNRTLPDFVRVKPADRRRIVGRGDAEGPIVAIHAEHPCAEP